MSAEDASVSAATLGDRSGYFTLRAVLFLLWLVGANYWLSRHFGVGWDDPRITIGLAALGLGFGMFEVAGWDLKKWGINRLVRWLIQIPVLVVLYAALAIAASVWSSVILLNDPSGDSLRATLTPADRAGAASRQEDNASNRKEPVRFLAVATTPLGRPYRLDVKGYLSQTFQVSPIFGVTLSPRDLRVSPSVLFRPPPGAKVAMAGFKIWLEEDPKKVLAEGKKAEPTSILLGSEQPIPPALLESWRLEAMAQGYPDKVLAQVLTFWKTPTIRAPSAPLEPGSRIVAMVYNATDEPLATAHWRLTDERLQDVPMTPVESPASTHSDAAPGGSAP